MFGKCSFFLALHVLNSVFSIFLTLCVTSAEQCFYLGWLCVLSAQIKVVRGDLILSRVVGGSMNAFGETGFVCEVMRKGCHFEVILIACSADLDIHCLLFQQELPWITQHSPTSLRTHNNAVWPECSWQFSMLFVILLLFHLLSRQSDPLSCKQG